MPTFSLVARGGAFEVRRVRRAQLFRVSRLDRQEHAQIGDHPVLQALHRLPEFVSSCNCHARLSLSLAI